MSADEDIRRPIMPALPEEEQKKKGFLGMFSSKKQKASVEETMLKEHIAGEKPQESIQKDFEEQVAKEEEEAPAPPTQTLVEDQTPPITEPVPDEEVPVPTPLLKKAEQEETPSVKRLEEQLQELKASTKAKEHLVNFNIMGGKRAVTLQDLRKVIQQMPGEEFERHHADKEFSLWIRTHLFDNELAGKLQEAVTKQQALQAIDDELKPRVTIPTIPESPKKHEDHVEEHFNTLQSTHEKTMDELHKAVKQPATTATKDYLKNALQTKDGRIIDNLNDLVGAVELLNDETYTNMLVTRKEDFADHIKELAQRAARISSLNPAQLQAGIVELLTQQKNHIGQTIAQEKELIADQANQLLKKEDEIIKQEEALKGTIETLKQARQQVIQQRESWERDVEERENELHAREEDVSKLIGEQEEAINELKKTLEEKESAIKEQEHALDEKRQAIREEEMGLAERKQRELKEVEEERNRVEERKNSLDKMEADLQAREDRIAQDKQAYEEAMQKREQLVQETVDKIIDIDEDISDQQEKIVRMKKELDSEGFKKYLQRTLRGINTDHIQFKERAEEADMKKKHVTIYTKIDACNDAIENHQLQEAKQLYAELKGAFEKEPLEESEKEELYDAIREIYANLHLALLEERT